VDKRGDGGEDKAIEVVVYRVEDSEASELGDEWGELARVAIWIKVMHRGRWGSPMRLGKRPWLDSTWLDRGFESRDVDFWC
jgi:hypothetical protein